MAYKDSVGVWTWAAGITSASGHKVERYIDNPQTLERCIEVFAWLLETKYLPPVLKAFKGHDLTETQLGAALSFHWNTGAINKATWVKRFMAGDVQGAKTAFMWYKKPKAIIGRRKKERDLFFGGQWSNDGTCTEITRVNSNYSPIWSSSKKINIETALQAAFEVKTANSGAKDAKTSHSGQKTGIVAILIKLIQSILRTFKK